MVRALALLSLVAATSARAEARARRLNVGADASVPYPTRQMFSADDRWVVWTQVDPDPDVDRVQLLSVRRWEGSSPVALTPVRTEFSSFQLSAATEDGWLLVSTSGASGWSGYWSIRIDGTAPLTRLSPVIAWSNLPGTAPLIVGDRAIFAGDFRNPGVIEVYSAPIDGSGPPVVLHPEPAPGGGVASSQAFAGSTPDGSKVAFRADLEGDGEIDLWIAPTDGSAPARKLDAEPGSSGDVTPGGAWISPDGSRSLYLEGTGTSWWGAKTLWSVPSDGSAPAIALCGGGGHWPRLVVQSGGITESSVRWVGDSDGDARDELWIAPLAGPPEAAIRLAESSLPGRRIDDFRHYLTPARTHVVFEGGLEGTPLGEVWIVPVDGSTAPERLSPPLPQPPGGSFDLLHGEGRGRAVLIGQPYGSPRQIWSALVEPGAAAIRIDGVPVDGEILAVARTLLADRVVFSSIRESSFVDLWSVPEDGRWSPRPIYRAPSWETSASQFWTLEGSGTVLIQIPIDSWLPKELWEARLDGPDSAARRIHPPLTNGASATGDLSWRSRDRHAALFTGDFDADPDLELWIVDDVVFRADFELGDLSEWSAVSSVGYGATSVR